ncbi:hypothetical protein TGME49_275660 [Toxoplasma gondii ME49]|uniref:Methyltransferase n=13 Tax=Toxoplasma gondii TaxID=5811 RepID=B9PX77_TOXGV|nr:hypothetical protein TGME49_275660 [Toxoplasma gondii ME49]EPR59224.1 hypothetical protein TGGT1_275660 [Toxoplasma gondii GT1]ESS30171.1 methyltransferase [Toxoplasma gondii VEG]KAF4645473.1 hypothetical protein TGRH88_005770 [Toxoplasma gondii]KFG29985.1 methyltransferase [Toxoplasma gondii GAB2-2007-GAL-DOM2]KFG37218.1 methyltransferase [Toxoplasma gondii FOU]KFG47446.1 methyltransferase [Toxoplasma gondii p89]KFG57969.1 methyltransferase [Toxoplasma gondii RUB]KFH03116.1 methyltransf|eukprot:XP_002371593.1 hypothetical protein TGME49_275660 [Toxoplasma gondii ME49]
MKGSSASSLLHIARRLPGALILVGMSIVLGIVRVVEDAFVFLASFFEDKTWNAAHVARMRFLSTFIYPVAAASKEEQGQKGNKSRDPEEKKETATCPYLPDEFPLAHDSSERRFLTGFCPVFLIRCIMRFMSVFPSWHAELVYWCSRLCHKLSFVSELSRAFLQLWGYVTVRTAHFESFFRWAVLKKDVQQVILVGAGFDTRAYRFAEIIKHKGVCVFEMDLHNVQRHKCRQLLRSLKADDLLNGYRTLRFIPCDLESDRFEEKLRCPGIRHDVNTAFIVEGVSPYVSTDKLRHMLDDIRKYFTLSGDENSGPKGAEVHLLMDYLIDADDSKNDYTEETRIAEGKKFKDERQEAGARWGGEQWRHGPLKRMRHLITHAPEKWTFLPANMATWVEDFGWKEVCRTNGDAVKASLADHRYNHIFESVNELPTCISLFQLKRGD